MLLFAACAVLHNGFLEGVCQLARVGEWELASPLKFGTSRASPTFSHVAGRTDASCASIGADNSSKLPVRTDASVRAHVPSHQASDMVSVCVCVCVAV